MTPDNPTTATAASKNDLASTIYNILLQTHGDGMATENLHQIRDRIVAAVNATGTGDKQMIGELKNEVFNLRSALAAAREQHNIAQHELSKKFLADTNNLRIELTEARLDLQKYREQHGALIGELKNEVFNLRSALAAARDELTAARLLHDKMVGELTDEEWIERAKTPGFALRAAGGGGGR